MNKNLKEWLKTTQKSGSYYRFEEKSTLGKKFFDALKEKRENGFYLDEDRKQEGFMASVYGVCELLSISDNFLNGSSASGDFLKNFSAKEQKSLALEIKGIYGHIKKYGFDFEPIISSKVNERIFRRREDEKDRQKYPFFGAMTWVLSISTMLWKKYFVYTETGNKESIDAKKEIISDAEAVEIIRSLETEIKDSIRHIIRLFCNTYMHPQDDDVKEVNVLRYGDDNEGLKRYAAKEGLHFGWGYTKGVSRPSLYFTFSVLEAYSDFDSNILIGGDDDNYFTPTKEEEEQGLEGTKNTSVYSREGRLFNGLIDYINSDVERDASGNAVRVPSKISYDKMFRKQAIQCAYYLFYKFKDSIAESFYNDDGYPVSRQQITLSSTTSGVFYPLYILSSLLNGEVNGTIKTQLMYTRRERLNTINKEEIERLDGDIKYFEEEYKQFEDCFIDGLNNVQKMYTFMDKNKRLDVIDRHYLTFDQLHTEEPQLARALSRENVLAMTLLPLLVNVTNLYVLWVTQFPDKQISIYINDIFENYCNRAEDGKLEWVFEQGVYDLHVTVRYIDAISNFFTYYDIYEKDYAENKIKVKNAKEAAIAELRPKYDQEQQKLLVKHNEAEKELKDKIDDLEKKLDQTDEKFSKVFDVENSALIRLSEVLNQYVESKKSGGRPSPHEAAIDAFMQALARAVVLKLSASPENVEKYCKEIEQGISILFNKREEDHDLGIEYSFANFFNSFIEHDPLIFEGNIKSDQD